MNKGKIDKRTNGQIFDDVVVGLRHIGLVDHEPIMSAAVAFLMRGERDALLQCEQKIAESVGEVCRAVGKVRENLVSAIEELAKIDE